MRAALPLTKDRLMQICIDPVLEFRGGKRGCRVRPAIRHDRPGIWNGWNLYDCKRVNSPGGSRNERARSGKVAVIAGAGPAGLTAALEMLRRSDIMPIVFEADGQVGGISKTINYRGNRMDLGGHRFFSKSDWVMRWWQEILPVAEGQSEPGSGAAHRLPGQERGLGSRGVWRGRASDAVLLVRQRLSRIFYRRRFFDYPLKINPNTIRNMGLIETLRSGHELCASATRPPIARSISRGFLINRFGDRLYRTFFKSYTEKVWGVSCEEISAEWGAQRIKGLSVSKAIAHALKAPFRSSADTAQKGHRDQPHRALSVSEARSGQMWEEVARRMPQRGGDVHLDHRVVGIERTDLRVTAVQVRDERDWFGPQGALRLLHLHHAGARSGDVLEARRCGAAADRRRTSVSGFHDGRVALAKDDLPRNRRNHVRNGMPPDNWIYIQEPDVRLGRLQVFNNWSPSMVADPDTIWLGLEYFCREGDDLWSMADGRFSISRRGELA